MRHAQGGTLMTDVDLRTPEALADAERWTAHNYHPLPVVVAEADGAWVTDVDGRRYLDFLAGYSALNFGHRHPGLIAAAHAQLDRVTLTSRAFVHDQFAEFCHGLAELCGKDLVLPMNTGAEAVETAIKVARAWGYRVKGVPRGHPGGGGGEPATRGAGPGGCGARGVPAGRPNLVVAEATFQGRTPTFVSSPPAPAARNAFAPYPPGSTIVPSGDAEALPA